MKSFPLHGRAQEKRAASLPARSPVQRSRYDLGEESVPGAGNPPDRPSTLCIPPTDGPPQDFSYPSIVPVFFPVPSKGITHFGAANVPHESIAHALGAAPEKERGRCHADTGPESSWATGATAGLRARCRPHCATALRRERAWLTRYRQCRAGRCRPAPGWFCPLSRRTAS